jgi:hypothetical protein
LRVLERFSELSNEEVLAWSSTVLESLADTLTKVVTIEAQIEDELVKLKLKAYGISGDDEDSNEEDESNGEANVEVIVYTPYGKGKLLRKRKDTFKLSSGEYITTAMTVVQLDFGILYRPEPGSTKHHPAPPKPKPPKSAATKEDFIPSSPTLSRVNWWERLVPAIKVRCVTAYCLQHYLYDLLSPFVPSAEKDVISRLLESLNKSSTVAGRASKDEDLYHAFQEAMFSEWGDGVLEVEETLTASGRLGQRKGSEMFFLTQEAGATNDIIHLLAILYQFDPSKGMVEWDREAFAEPFLLDRIMEVFEKFLESERKEGHLIDPNVWRNASESGGKVAIYCTSFASVVVNSLKVMLSISQEQFTKHKQKFFPILCSLVRVQSDEIRGLIQEVLQRQVAPMIGVRM